MKTTRYCFALDLINDVELIEEYKKQHRQVWPEVEASLLASGVSSLEIYLVENRLFMILEADIDFRLEEKTRLDEANARVQEWERLMWKYQKSLPGAKPGEKWILMDKMYNFKS
jgi:L-rhamnose mutarotase